MGKILSSTLFPEYLAEENIENFTSLFKQYNLNIDDNFSWLSGNSPLKFALSFLKFELADSLVASGAIIKPEILQYGVN